MSIEHVIARSRQPGEFKEKRHFTVAKDQAIQKMRKFALASPYNYILELIQAANANGATYIDIQNAQNSVTLSYVGGGFAPDELAQLFDFLFASKDRLDLAALRQLALGVNALMVAKPHLVVIESGKGTLESTTRVVISGHGTSVDVGTPSAPLDGTYVRADGLVRGLLGHSDPKEREVIERCCLTAPVPLLYNDEPLFGYRTMRIPKISGYERVVTFDEGDFFGAIGVTNSQTLANFKILTYGVWVQSLEYEFTKNTRVGGVVSFNRLRKTADHASIVHDDVLEEMWLRMRPYVDQLLGGQSGVATFNVRKLGDTKTLMPVHLRQLAASVPNVVAFRSAAVSSPAKQALAKEFGEVLEAEVLVYERDSDRAAMELLVAGARLSFPELSADEIAFYRLPRATPPAPPWLCDEKRLTPISKDEFVGALGEYESLPAVRAYVDALEADDVMSLTAYVPFEEPLRGRSVAQVRLAGRPLCTCAVGGTSGFCLAIDLPERERKALVSSVDARHAVSLAEVVANVIAEVRAAELDPIVDAVVRDTPWDSQSPNARTLVLSRIAAAIMIKFEEQDERVRVDLVKAPGSSLASSSMPLFRGRDARRAIWEVEGVMDRSHGLVYAIADGH